MEPRHVKMKRDSESLFSLELVVEKLYIPHEVCRFPSIAFRLLDFPTILIDHVESDLAMKIRTKVNSDPYYELPKQINELTDKHGNFVIKKGKSCLLKLPASSLQMHLSNTPMYIMVIDSYPEVPKLLGNTTVALDQEICNIMEDIRRLGDTVPSVHGDKGLFKVFNLMGKEIGYVILGYRLMSLGSGLIPHIPENAIIKRQSESVQEQSQQVREGINKQHQVNVVSEKGRRQDNRSNFSPRKQLSTSQDMGSMTEPEKHDVLMQTIDMCDKEIHVALSDVNTEKPKDLQTVSTQTHKKQKQREQRIVSIELKPPSDESDDEFIINNIVHPPPLFYNSENEPKVKIHRPYLYYQDDASSVYTDELTTDDLSDNEKIYNSTVPSKTYVKKSLPQKHINRASSKPVTNIPVEDRNPVQGPFQNLMNGFPHSMSNGPIFPMLTALLNELSKLQDPRFVQSAVNQVNVVTQERRVQPKPQPRVTQKTENISSPSKLVVDENKENLQNEKDLKIRGRKSHKTCSAPSDGVAKKKGWIRQTPNVGVSKSKLAYGLTNTQRLRLAKVNPDWLKTIEKEEQEAKSLKSKPATKKEDEEFETGNLSDTLTEVRRLAQKNLNEMDDTMEQVDAKLENTATSNVANLSLSKTRRRISPPRKHKSTSPSPTRKPSKLPKHKYLSKVQMSSKSDSKEDEGTMKEKTEQDQQAVSDEEDIKSYKSLEVRIPSAQLYADDSDFSVTESESPKSYKYPGYAENRSEENTPKENRFPGFMDHNVSVPESINGNANDSFNFTKENEFEDDQPLESTRYSKPNKSHDDIDTHQFHSTEEPELQKLISSGEKSQVSDILSSDRSVISPLPQTDYNMASARFQVLNPKASMNSPIPAIRRSQVKPEGSTKTSPVVTPRSPNSSNQPTPTPRKKTVPKKRLEYKHESIHTESVSSYVPSDDEDFLGSGNYSDDFNEDGSSRMSPSPVVGGSSKWIPSTKLGYTIS